MTTETHSTTRKAWCRHCHHEEPHQVWSIQEDGIWSYRPAFCLTCKRWAS